MIVAIEFRNIEVRAKILIVDLVLVILEDQPGLGLGGTRGPVEVRRKTANNSGDDAILANHFFHGHFPSDIFDHPLIVLVVVPTHRAFVDPIRAGAKRKELPGGQAQFVYAATPAR